MTAECPYTLQRAAPSPKILPLPMGGYGPHLIRSSRVLIPNGILIGSTVFAGLTSVTVTDGQTDRPADRQTTLLGL